MNLDFLSDVLAGAAVAAAMIAFGFLMYYAIDHDHAKEVRTAQKLNKLCVPHKGVRELKLINDGRGGGSAICRDGWVVSV